MGVILKENNIIYTYQQHEKFLGSSQWRYDASTNTLVNKKFDCVQSNILDEELSVSDNDANIEEFLRVSLSQEKQKALEKSLRQDEEPKQRVYKLNKKKVREKCTALFGLKQSIKFLAFITISFPLGLSDDEIMQCFNTFLTRCRKNANLSTYLWVAEYQANGTLHFHMLTNNYLPIRQINYYMSKCIENTIRKSKRHINFIASKYNGVDIKRCENNKKRLRQYLTKYISKNTISFYRLPYHSSRDISQLFTAQSFVNEFSKDFQHIAAALKHIQTVVVENEYCTIEYLSVMQPNGKFFNPPNDWFRLLNYMNEHIYKNFHEYQFLRLPLNK